MVEINLVAIQFSVVVLLLPMLEAILGSGLEILPVMNPFNQSEKLFHFRFAPKDDL